MTQLETTAHSTKTRRDTVEGSSRSTDSPALVVRTVARDTVNFWKPRLRRQRYGSKSAGTFVELPKLYVRISHLGREHAFTFETLDKNSAATQARDLYRDVLSKGWDAVLATKRPKPVEPAQRPTVADLLREADEKGVLKTMTLRNYANCLRTIISEAKGLGGSKSRFDYKGGGNAAWRKKVDAVSLDEITVDLVQKWKASRLKAATHSPAAEQSARRTINSYIRCSRSLFARRLRKLLNLRWPQPLPFADVELEPAGSMAYRSTIKPAALIRAAKQELAGARAEEYKVFLLGFAAGLRRGEIDGLEWSAFDWKARLLRIRVTASTGLKTDASEGEIPLDSEVVTVFKRFHAGRKSEFVVETPRSPKRSLSLRVYRCASVFDALNEWLRQHGVTANKPLHTLRKELGALVTTKHGIYAAKDILRHSDISTTARHYADQKKRVSVGLGRMIASST